LAKDGVIDTAPMYRPEDGLNRAELIKMVMTATDGLEGYLPPANPTFDDVLPGAWYTNYIEAAATKGIVYGYTDAEGNLTGKFGPNDTVTRAEAAKILVNAFAISTELELNSVFPDVKPDDWFHDYVVTAYNESILDGYNNGIFGPGDPITRAQIAKLIVNAQNPVERSDNDLLNDDVSPGFLDDPEEYDEEESGVEEGVEEEVPQAEANTASIEAMSIQGGASEVFVAKYNFRALYEGFRVETVTVVNDITGNKMGDQAVNTPAIRNILLKFPDKDGREATASAAMGADGKTRFSGLDFFIPRYEEAFLEIYADLTPFSEVGESLSGQVFRLGLQDINNNSDTFRAVGDVSSAVIGYNGSQLSVTSSQSPQFTVRRSTPLLSRNELPTNLVGGDTTLFSFNVAAEGSSGIGLARLTFDLSVNEASGADLSLNDFRFYRGSTLLSDVTIYDATGLQDLSATGGGSLTSGLSSVVVSFDQEEVISGGDSLTYSLKAQANNVQNNDTLSVGLSDGDEEAVLSGLTAINQPNTGKVYVSGDATAGIFTAASDFSQSAGVGRDLIWSDRSADVHLYPTVSGGIITSDSGSYDWTNGYQLGLSGLSDQVLSR